MRRRQAGRISAARRRIYPVTFFLRGTAMKHIWLYLNKTDIETERRQCEEEGRDLSSVEEDFARVLALDLEDLTNQPQAEALLDKTILLPIKSDFKYVEPSDLEGIRAARPADRLKLPALSLPDSELEDKIYGAWAGRCTGCLLGKPVEGWKRPQDVGLPQRPEPLAPERLFPLRCRHARSPRKIRPGQKLGANSSWRISKTRCRRTTTRITPRPASR